MGNVLQTERRVDVFTGRQVIVASNRADRPIQQSEASNTIPSPADDPFLQGQELNTPDERLALRKITSRPNQPGWLVRVVPNRYPAVTEAVGPSPSAAISAATTDGFFASSPATGVHDVVIECPDLRSRLVELSVVEFARVLLAWQQRLQQILSIADTTGIQAVSIFRNEGFGSGASLPHCHSQIVGMDFPGAQLQQRTQQAANFQKTTGQCLYQHWLQSELDAGQRVVRSTDRLAAVCPFASRLPWHTRIGPGLTGETDFRCLDEQDLRLLAGTVSGIAQSLQQVAGRVAFNLTLVLPPVKGMAEFPWMLDLLPRPHRFAGFEIMTDLDILTVAPETAARQLREHADWGTTHDSQPLCPRGYRWQTP